MTNEEGKQSIFVPYAMFKISRFQAIIFISEPISPFKAFPFSNCRSPFISSLACRAFYKPQSHLSTK
jgi:hypothetical protein